MLKKFLIGTMALALMLTVASSVNAFSGVTLKVGSRGADVMELQTLVGATPVDGVFGPMTKAKVMAWQANNGLVADGVFGPMSMAKAAGSVVVGTLPAGCTAGAMYSSTTGQSCSVVTTLPAGCTAGALFSSTTGQSCTGGTTPVVVGLTGTAGEITEINQISSYNNEEVGDGSNDVKVMGFEIVTSKDGDVGIKSIKLTFDGANSTGSTRLADYLDSVSIMQGSTVVATVDTSDFTKDATGIYSKTIALDNSVVKADKTEKFYVTVDAVSNLDSGDISGTADDWEVGINNVRYVDGSGVVTTESDLMPAAIEYNTTGDGVNISFVSFSTSADTELKISTDNTPDSQVVKVSTTNDTSKVTLLKGKMKLSGTSDVWLDKVPFLFTTTATDVDAVTPTVYLTIDGEEFSESMTATAGTTEEIAFDNLDLTIDAGSTVSFTVAADINDIEAGTFDEGVTLQAELTTTLRDGATFVAENEQGDALVDASEKTGSALGEAQAFYSKGINVSLVSKSAAITTAGDASATTPTSDTGTFTIVFDVTAFGDDMRIDKDPAEDTSTFTTVTQLSYSLSGDASVAATTSSLTSSTGATLGTESFLVEEDKTERFTLTVAGTATADVFTNVKLEGIGWTAGSTDAVGANIYTFNLDDFKTADLYLNNN